MRTKVEYRTSSKQAYAKFCTAHPEVNLSFDKWKEIIYTFNTLFRDHLLDSGDRCKLPWGLGTFSVSKKKSKKIIKVNGKEYVNLAVDWIKTLKAGKYVYQFNSHTDGYRYKWKWFFKDARFFQSDIWAFKPSRSSSRKLAEYLKRPNSHYPQLYKEWDLRKRL